MCVFVSVGGNMAVVTVLVGDFMLKAWRGKQKNVLLVVVFLPQEEVIIVLILFWCH